MKLGKDHVRKCCSTSKFIDAYSYASHCKIFIFIRSAAHATHSSSSFVMDLVHPYIRNICAHMYSCKRCNVQEESFTCSNCKPIHSTKIPCIVNHTNIRKGEHGKHTLEHYFLSLFLEEISFMLAFPHSHNHTPSRQLFNLLHITHSIRIEYTTFLVCFFVFFRYSVPCAR